MYFNNYMAPVHIWQQSVPHCINIYFNLLYKNYYSSALYEIDVVVHLGNLGAPVL